MNFPLTQDEKDAIMNTLFLIGSATLTAGSITIYNPKVLASSRGFVTRNVSGGTIGDLTITCNNGSFTITSASGSDTSTVNYFIVL